VEKAVMTPFKTLRHLILSAFIGAGLWSSPAHAAGTTPLALVPQVDSAGNIASGCLLNFYVAGTVATPQNAYADFGLTTPLSNPIQCDQAGRVPMHWLADGLIHVRLTTFDGTPLVDTTMQVLGPSSGGGGGGGTVDPTTILVTGDMKLRYGTGPIAGFVRLNSLTIGNAVSGATERANADTQALFVYLYTTDAALPVTGGRTGNALNDYNANKQITTPDWRGRAIAGLDDMGATPAGRLTATYFGSSATVLGNGGGNEKMPGLATTHLPAQTPSGGVVLNSLAFNAANISSAASGCCGNVTTGGFSATGALVLNAPTSSLTFTGTPFVGQNSTPFAIASPAKVTTIYMKL
jgi:hypothetical protein